MQGAEIPLRFLRKRRYFSALLCRHVFIYSGSFYKFRMAFGTGHLNFSVSFWNTDLLLAGGTGVDAEGLLLFGQILLAAEKAPHSFRFRKKPLVFLVALRIISGEHSKIYPDHSGGKQKIENRISEKKVDKAQEEQGKK